MISRAGSAFALALALGACSDPPSPRVCEPGRSVVCAGIGGCSGFQACAPDGDRWAECQCADAHVELDAALLTDSGGIDAHVALDGAGSDTGPIDASESSDGGADAATDGTVGDAWADRPPRADCDPHVTAFPASFTVDGSAEDPDRDLITAFTWRLRDRPAGSTTAFTNPGVPSFAFTPDLAGLYAFCLTVSAGGQTSTEVCCDYSSPADFRWTFDSSRSTRYVEEVEMYQGHMELAFATNQPLEETARMVTVSDPLWFALSGGSGTSAFNFSAQVHVDVAASDTSAITAGDSVTVRSTVTPSVIGPSTVVTATIMLAATPEPDATSTPRLVSFDSTLFAGTPGPVHVRFDSGRPAAAYVAVGGYVIPSTGFFVNDAGTGDDVVAGDGIYSGRMNVLTAGTYDVLLQPQIDYTSGVAGPYFRTTITVR